MTVYGRVVIDEIPLDVTDIRFAHGQVFITASTTGVKARLDEEAEMTLFAPDGTVVVHRPSRSRGCRILKVRRADSLTLTWRWFLTADPS